MNCLNCNEVIPGKWKSNKKFCNDSCRHKHYAANHKEQLKEYDRTRSDVKRNNPIESLTRRKNGTTMTLKIEDLCGACKQKIHAEFC